MLAYVRVIFGKKRPDDESAKERERKRIKEGEKKATKDRKEGEKKERRLSKDLNCGKDGSFPSF